LEDQIAKEAMQALAQGRPRVSFFDLMPSEEYLVGYGKGCFGQLWVLLEPVTPEMPAATRALLAELSDVTRPTGVAVVYESEGEGALPAGTRVLVDVEHVVATNAAVEAAGELAARVADGLAAGVSHHGELAN